MGNEIDELTWGKLPDLFRRDVDRTGDCWLWIGPTFLPKESKKPRANYSNMPVYLFAYRLAHDKPPKGMQLHHACHQPLCVKPSHLEVLTKDQHMAKHGSGPLREVCKNGHSIKQFGEYIFPNGLKVCQECLRLRKSRVLAKLNALPSSEKLKRSRKSRQYKKARMERDPNYAAQQKHYRDTYNKCYQKEKREELIRKRRARYSALPTEVKRARNRKITENTKRRMASDSDYAKDVKRKKLAYQRRYNADNRDRVRAQRHAAYLGRKTRHAQPPG